jgi:hypothetical protein
MFLIKKILLFHFLFLSAIVVAAQHNYTHGHEHDHNHGEAHNYHLGFGVGAAGFLGDNHLDPALHIHFLRKINSKNNLSVGLGYEGIIDDNWHNGFNLLLNYRPVSFLSLNIGPGIVTEKEDDEREFLPALHAESVFEFNVSGVHLGPMIGFGMNKEHKHVSVGLHIGFGL